MRWRAAASRWGADSRSSAGVLSRSASSLRVDALSGVDDRAESRAGLSDLSEFREALEPGAGIPKRAGETTVAPCRFCRRRAGRPPARGGCSPGRTCGGMSARVSRIASERIVRAYSCTTYAPQATCISSIP